MPNNTLLITLAQPKPEETETFHSYVGGSTGLALEAGGQVSSRFGVRHLIGDAPATVFGLATFPSSETITSMFDSPAYQALVPAREQSTECGNAYIVEEPSITALPDTDGAYLVVVAAPNPEAIGDLQAYQAASGPIFAKHGGKPVAELPISGRPIGDTPAAFIGVLEFASAEAAEAVFEDPDYLPLVPKRDSGLDSLNVYVTTS